MCEVIIEGTFVDVANCQVPLNVNICSPEIEYDKKQQKKLGNFGGSEIKAFGFKSNCFRTGFVCGLN